MVGKLRSPDASPAGRRFSARAGSTLAAVLGVLVCVASAVPSTSAATAARPGPYFLAPFTAHANRHTFGQDPTFTASGEVLSQELDGAGILQVHRSRLSGAGMKCLTCGRIPGPNGFAAERPTGGWILFCSYGDQPEHLGAPCLGGYGGDLYAMRENGSDVTRLTAASDPDGGAVYGPTHGTAYDNYHPYWSPDGRHLVWTRDEALPLAQGGARWEMMLADFLTPPRGRPRLAHVRVVGPAFGVYETQHWAPDGSGFLFSAFGPRHSPFGGSPGWMHQELYFMRLFGHGASPEHPRVTQLSDDLPVYQEQAAFTPDMREVIFMSNRNSPEGSWYDQVIAAAQRTGFDAPDPGATGTLQFLADFSDPNFRSDLFMLDVATRDLRELTDFHNVVPEFNWNVDFTKLLWSGQIGGANRRFVTRVGRFDLRAAASRRGPTRILSGGRAPAGARAGGAAALGAAIGTRGHDHQTLPTVVGSYFTLWVGQLERLGAMSGSNIGSVGFLSTSLGP